MTSKHQDRKHDPSIRYRFPDVAQRAADFESGNRDLRTNEELESAEGMGHSWPNGDPFSGAGGMQYPERNAIEEWINRSGSEVIVLVEGVEQMTGCSVQARHSYAPNDMVWDRTFPPCVSTGPSVSSDSAALDANRSPVTACSIDFAKFHRTVELARVSDGNPATSEGAEEDTDALFFSHA